MAPDSVSVPAPCLPRLPVPLITPDSVKSLDRFTTRLALLTMAPATKPAVEPLPKYKVPPDIVVLPVKVLLAVKYTSPAPVLVNVPTPVEMTPPMVALPSACTVKPYAPANALPVLGVIDKEPAST